MTAETKRWIFRQALRQLGYWLSEEEVEALMQRLPEIVEGL